MTFLSKLTAILFGKKKAQPALTEADLLDPAYIQMVRHNLKTVRDRAGENDFIRASNFLDAVESAVQESGLNNILAGGGWARVGAAHYILDSAVSGKMPFLYRIAPEARPGTRGTMIAPEDCYVPVAMLADHGLYLLDGAHETALASVYATALKTVCPQPLQVLRGDAHISYEDGRGAARFSKDFAARGGGVISVLYLRPQQKTPRPPELS